MRELPDYPADHQVGMRVPLGGSMCMRCEYVDGQDCTQKDFVKWNGKARIPDPVEEYCCDFFEPKEMYKRAMKGKSSLAETVRKRK